MKRKVFSILFALVLALSLGIMALPIAGTVEASPDYIIQVDDEGFKTHLGYASNEIRYITAIGSGIVSEPFVIWYENRATNQIERVVSSSDENGFTTGTAISFSTIANTLGDGGVNHPAVVQMSGGRLGMYFWAGHAVDSLSFSISTDGGLTWSDPAAVDISGIPYPPSPPGSPHYGTFGVIDAVEVGGRIRLYFVDNFGDQSIRVVESELGLTGDARYTDFDGVNGRVVLSVGTGGGGVPKTPSDNPDTVQYNPTGEVVQLADGTWVLSYIAGDDGYLGLAQSADGLTGWTVSRGPSNPLIQGNSGGHTDIREVGAVSIGSFGLLYDAKFPSVGSKKYVGYATVTFTPPPSEVWVDDEGNDSNPGTEAEPFATIQKGIDCVAEGGTINVAAGTYTEQIVVDVPDLTIQSVGDAENTIIDADGGCSTYPEPPDIPVKITTNNVMLDGFTITGAYCGLTPDMHSGVDLAAVGVYIDGVTGCTILNCIFKDNDVPGIPGLHSDGYTYLIFLADDSDSNYIKNNVMTNNGLSYEERGENASRGHAILLDSHCDNCEITDNEIYENEFGAISLGTRFQGNYNNFNLISGNTIHDDDGTGILLFIGNDDNQILDNTIQDNTGAGIRLYFGSNDGNLIKNNLITGIDDDGIYMINHQSYDSTGNDIIGNTITSNNNGIYLENNKFDMVIKNNIIVENAANGIPCVNVDTTPTLSYNDVWGNTGGDYSGCSAGTGCISSDPLFVTGPDGDYYLSQTAAGQASNSLCVNAGDLATALYGTTRTDEVGDSDVIDMGYHYSLPPNNPPNTPTSPQCEGETNPTGVTDLTPEFSWTFSDPDDGDTQGAYQIIVGASEGGSDMWDSSKIDSSSSTDIPYAGSALAWGATYLWKVKTWDSHDAESSYCAEQTFTMAELPATVVLTADPTDITADGSSTSTITATVEDQYGAAVIDGTDVLFETDHGRLGSETITKSTVGGVATATLTSESSTETLIATVTATANGAKDATAVFFIPEGGAEVEESKTETIDGSGTMENAPTGGDVTIDATGDHTVSIAKYESNPGGTPTFEATGDYYDVHLDNADDVASLTIEFCLADEDTVIYYWDGASWVAASDQSYSDGCIVVTITSSTSPSLSNLTGLPFASGTPAPPPIGGTVYPSNNLALLAPWIGLIAAIIAGALIITRCRRIWS